MGNIDQKVRAFFEIYLAGLFMGMGGIVSGVSVATLALVVGIYERLIFAIRTISFRWLWYLLRGKTTRARRDFAAIDCALFIPCILGIITTLFFFSELLLFFRIQFPNSTAAFFFAVVLASSYFTLRRIEKITLSQILCFVIGLVVSYFGVNIPLFEMDHSLATIFISAFFAMGAMVLPGVSGTFLLHVLGQYEYLIEALFTPNFAIIFIFLAGALSGILFFAHLLAGFLTHHRSGTMLFLLGMMLGALW